MTTTETTSVPGTTRSVPTRGLLTCGVAAGLLFPIASFAQAFTRPGFDLSRHSLSSLALGDLGWLQITNFVLTGLLSCAFAVGLRRALRPGRVDVAGPILLGLYGVAMIGGGLFVPDPAYGWPEGAPEGLPERLSTGSILHTIFGIMAFMSLIIAGLMFARRFAAHRQPGWAVYSAASGIAAFLITTPPWGTASESLRFAAGAVIISSWLLVIAWRLRAKQPA